MNCLYKPAPLDNFISNGVNAPRKRRASSATPKSANKWLGGEEFCILHSAFFNFQLERSDVSSVVKKNGG